MGEFYSFIWDMCIVPVKPCRPTMDLGVIFRISFHCVNILSILCFALLYKFYGEVLNVNQVVCHANSNVQ